MEKILVATDGSETAENAVREARKLAECMGANVRIIYVSEELASDPYHLTAREYVSIINEDAKRFGEGVLKKSLELFEDFPGEVDTILKTGDASKAIIYEAESGKYDLIVMGSRGLGAFSKTMLGSVTNKVLNHVHTKVYIVR